MFGIYKKNNYLIILKYPLKCGYFFLYKIEYDFSK